MKEWRQQQALLLVPCFHMICTQSIQSHQTAVLICTQSIQSHQTAVLICTQSIQSRQTVVLICTQDKWILTTSAVFNIFANAHIQFSTTNSNKTTILIILRLRIFLHSQTLEYFCTAQDISGPSLDLLGPSRIDNNLFVSSRVASRLRNAARFF